MRTTNPVCVTGASGFIAAHIVRERLERGYTVRGTVRILAKPEKHAYSTALPGAADLGFDFTPAKASVLATVEDLFGHGHLERPAMKKEQR